MPEAETTTPPPTPPAQEAPPETPPESDDTDWKAEARKWEQRAKDNKSAAERLAALEDANKSELEKANEKALAAEKAAEKAQADALRLRVALKHNVSDEDADLFLTGTDEETLTKQAQRLTDRGSERKPKNRVPREGTPPREAPEDEMREFTRNLFRSAQNT